MVPSMIECAARLHVLGCEKSLTIIFLIFTIFILVWVVVAMMMHLMLMLEVVMNLASFLIRYPCCHCLLYTYFRTVNAIIVAPYYY